MGTSFFTSAVRLLNNGGCAQERIDDYHVHSLHPSGCFDEIHMTINVLYTPHRLLLKHLLRGWGLEDKEQK